MPRGRYNITVKWAVVGPDGKDRWTEKTKKEAIRVSRLYTKDTKETWTYRRIVISSNFIDLTTSDDTELSDLVKLR